VMDEYFWSIGSQPPKPGLHIGLSLDDAPMGTTTQDHNRSRTNFVVDVSSAGFEGRH